MSKTTISAPARVSDEVLTDMIVAELLDRWPESARVFHQFKTACVGCALAPFGTVADVIRVYELDEERFLQALRQVAGR